MTLFISILRVEIILSSKIEYKNRPGTRNRERGVVKIESEIRAPTKKMDLLFE